MRHKVVHRLLDRLAGRKMAELANEELPVERVRMIPVDLAPLVEREVRMVEVVRVHVDERDRLGVQRLCDIPGDGRFAGSRTTSNSDDKGFHRL
jgi:hypothetical protein